MAVKKDKEPKTEVTVTLRDPRFPVAFFFNRFRVEKLEGQFLIQFGLVSGYETLTHYSVILEKASVDSTRTNVLAFLGESGPLPEAPLESWKAPRGEGAVGVANMIMIARTGDIGELRLGIYASGALFDGGRPASGKVSVEGAPVALLRCPVDVLKLVIVAIFTTESV